jgi:hypothetical protein
MAWTRVKILRPGWKPPVRPVSLMVALHKAFETQPLHQRGDEQQPGIGHQIRIVEGHGDPVDTARYWLHRKCLLCVGETTTSNTVIFPRKEALSADAERVNQLSRRWIEA